MEEKSAYSLSLLGGEGNLLFPFLIKSYNEILFSACIYNMGINLEAIQ
jgi:hypothetical protein